jgi:hypothetical protein
MIAHSYITGESGSEEQCAVAEGAALSALVSLASFLVTPIFKDKNRMHKRLMCALGIGRTHK